MLQLNCSEQYGLCKRGEEESAGGVEWTEESSVIEEKRRE